MRGGLLDGDERLQAVGRDAHGMACVLENQAEHLPNVVIVVDDQQLVVHGQMIDLGAPPLESVYTRGGLRSGAQKTVDEAVDGGRRLAPRLCGRFGTRNEHCGFVEGPEEYVGDDVDVVDGEATGFGDGLQPVLEQSESVLLVDLPPPLPPEDSRGVGEDDLAHGRVLHQCDPLCAPRSQDLHRIPVARHGPHELFHDTLLDVFDHGLEQTVLAVEVVVQRASADARLPEHLLDGRVVEALLGEQARRNVEQLAAGRLPLGDAAIHGCHDLCHVVRALPRL